MTKLEHRTRVTAMLTDHVPTSEYSPDLIDFFIDCEVIRVFKEFVALNSEDYRVKLTGVADGDLWPAEYLVFADSASYVDGGGKRRVFHTVQQAQVGKQRTNSFNKSTASNPGLLIEDFKFKTIPAGITGISVWVFKMPPQLFGAAESTDDTMPKWTQSMIHIGAFEALRELSIDAQKAAETLERRMQETIVSNKNFVERLSSMQTTSGRSLV